MWNVLKLKSNSVAAIQPLIFVFGRFFALIAIDLPMLTGLSSLSMFI